MTEQTMHKIIQVEMWSDLICPWCGIGEAHYKLALRDFPHRDSVRFVLRSYRLMPGSDTMPVEQVMRDKYNLGPDEMRQNFAKLEAMAAGLGLHYQLSGSWAGDTMDAHRLIKLADTFGQQMALYKRLFSAVIGERLCLQDHAVLKKLAAETGLNSQDVDRVLQGNEYASEVLADEKAMKGYGGRGVPFFVINGSQDYSGAIAPDILLAALNKAWEEKNTVSQEAHSGMVCGPDGCILPEQG